jgi:cytochrome P450
MMMLATDKKTGYSMAAELLKDETVNLLFAGQHTTINTLSWFFYLIGWHPEVHRQITEEVFKYKDDTLSVANLGKLVYTKAALYETLRLYPPSPALATQTVANIAIGGHLVTKGTTIILSSYVTHRHASLWKRPNEFYPEHFINPQMTTNRHKYAFYPFGGGLHNCIGRHFAELEMMIVIVTLLREFSFKTDNTVKEAASMTLKPDRDVMLSITPLSKNVN